MRQEIPRVDRGRLLEARDRLLVLPGLVVREAQVVAGRRVLRVEGGGSLEVLEGLRLAAGVPQLDARVEVAAGRVVAELQGLQDRLQRLLVPVEAAQDDGEVAPGELVGRVQADRLLERGDRLLGIDPLPDDAQPEVGPRILRILLRRRGEGLDGLLVLLEQEVRPADPHQLPAIGFALPVRADDLTQLLDALAVSSRPQERPALVERVVFLFLGECRDGEHENEAGRHEDAHGSPPGGAVSPHPLGTSRAWLRLKLPRWHRPPIRRLPPRPVRSHGVRRRSPSAPRR